MNSKNIIILASGNESIGMGHINRCLPVYFELSKLYNVSFYSLQSEYLKLFYEDNNIKYKLFENKYIMFEYIQRSLNFCILTDWYELNESNYRDLKSSTCNLASIVDYEGTYKWCDLIISPNICMCEDEFITNIECKKLVGKDYVLIKDSIIHSFCRNKENELTISLGGADLYGATLFIIDAVKEWVEKKKYKVNVVIGPYFEKKEDLKMACLKNKFRVIEKCNNLGPILSKSKYAIISGGITLHECLYLDIVPLVFVQAENQIEEVNFIENDKKLIYCGDLKNMNRTDIIESLKIGLREVHRLERKNGNKYLDGQGKTRIIQEIKCLLNKKGENYE